MPSLAGQLQENLINLIFPRRCVGCGRNGDYLCFSCVARLARIEAPFCERCGKPEPSGNLCYSCWRSPCMPDNIRSVYRFEGNIRRAVYDLKYHGIRDMAGQLGELMAMYLEKYSLYGDVLIPVPLSNRRLRKRGYNQSALLAKKIAAVIGLEYRDNCLARIRDDIPQALSSSVDKRRANVDGAFRCKEGDVKGMNAILIDDVCTSGATLEACAVALKSSGAACVNALTLAREM